LRTGVERWDVGAPLFGLVVVCGGAGNGCSTVGAAAVEGVGALAVAVDNGVRAEGGIADGERAGGVGTAGGVAVATVVVAAAVGDGVGVEGAGDVDNVGSVVVAAVVVASKRGGRRGMSNVDGNVGIAVPAASGSVRVVVEVRGR